MDCSKEALLDELSDFERQKPVEIPAVLEEYLRQVAKTGDTLFPWNRVKPLLCRKLEVVMNEFYESFPTDALPILPNVEAFNYDDMKCKILETLDTFTSAPFTIQRLCELVVDPRRHYKRTDKFMRGIEKNVLVVSTVEPKAASPLPLQQQCGGIPMVNGVPGIEDGGINGHTPDEPDSERECDDKMEEQRIPTISNAVDGLHTAEEDRTCNGASHTIVDSNASKELATTAPELPTTTTETTISHVDAKEHDADSRHPSESSAENVIAACSEDEVVAAPQEDEEKGCATSVVPAADSSQHSEPSSSTEPEEVTSSEPTETPLVEDVAEKCEEKNEEATDVGSSSEPEKDSHEDNLEEPPHKKFHPEGQDSVKECSEDSTPLEADEESISPDTTPATVTLEEPTPMAENGESAAPVAESMEMNEGPSEPLSSTDISDIADPEDSALVETKEEPMDQD